MVVSKNRSTKFRGKELQRGLLEADYRALAVRHTSLLRMDIKLQQSDFYANKHFVSSKKSGWEKYTKEQDQKPLKIVRSSLKSYGFKVLFGNNAFEQRPKAEVHQMYDRLEVIAIGSEPTINDYANDLELSVGKVGKLSSVMPSKSKFALLQKIGEGKAKYVVDQADPDHNSYEHLEDIFNSENTTRYEATPITDAPGRAPIDILLTTSKHFESWVKIDHASELDAFIWNSSTD